MKRPIHSLLIAGALVLPAGMHAGLPQPGMVLYGKVMDGPNLLTEGQVAWTFTPSNGQPPVTVRANLRELVTDGGEVFSYSIQIPVEQALPGSTARNGALLLGDAGLAVTRSATIGGADASLSNSSLGTGFVLSLEEHSGFVERVDLRLTSSASCCPGDANRDGFVTLADYIAVRQNFGDPNPSLGDGNCDGFVNLLDYLSVRDNIGATCDGSASRRFEPVDESPGYAGVWSAHPGNPTAGQQFEVRVLIDAEEHALRGASVLIEYDPAAIRFDGASTDHLLFNDASMTAEPRLSGIGRVAITAGSLEGINGAGIALATLRFSALQEGETALAIVADGPFTAAALDEEFTLRPVMFVQPSLPLVVAPPTQERDWRILEW